MSYIGAIDQGTSSSRFILFDKQGRAVAMHQMEHTQHYPQEGYVEHNPLEIWENVRTCIQKALEGASVEASQISAVGITNQRETTVVWNKHTGKPYHNAIVWNDARTADICDAIALEGKDRFRPKTGLPVSTYFSASKLLYLLENVPNLREDALKGDAIFGTIDSWLMWNLTNREVHATDVTNAGRTFLMDINTLQWDDELLELFQVPRAMLPEVKSSSEVYGVVSDSVGLDRLAGVRIAGILGDQHAALFGQACYNVGEAKCTFGTGAFLLKNTGARAVPSERGLLTTIAYQLGKDAPVCYALEGAVAYSGSLIQWLRDNMQIIDNVQESEALAASVKDNGGVYFVPAFAGLFAPYWRDDARGTIVGLTAYNKKAHIVRAALEASAFQVREIIDAMKADSGLKLVSLKVNGGVTKNQLLMQFQSDLLQVPLSRPQIVESTALGAAFAAGLAVGFWKSQDELKEIWKEDTTWRPQMETDKVDHLVHHWRKAIDRSLGWVEEKPYSKSGSKTSGRTDQKRSYSTLAVPAAYRHVDHGQRRWQAAGYRPATPIVSQHHLGRRLSTAERSGFSPAKYIGSISSLLKKYGRK